MRVKTILEYVVNSELASLAMRDITKPDNLEKVLGYLNRALAEVNKDFLLNQAETIITLKPARIKYFINDEKLLKVLAGYKSNGDELSLNDENDKDNTLFIPEYNAIEYFGENKATDTVDDFLSIIYLRGFDTVKTDLDTIRVNEGMTECIANYIGYLAHASLPKNSGPAASTFFKKYVDSVAKTKELNIIPESTYVATKLDDRGFV